ncbi:MAG TPA: zinc ribbon domain-containing protein [Firmicutes bacterium]|nr:zinc ribbon domain-containing protein [Bacillota bacterium]
MTGGINMNYCSKCGKEITDQSVTFCSQCGQKIESKTDQSNQPYQTNPTYPNQSNFSQPVIKDNPSHFAGAVSCCFPIVGLILFFIWKDDKPKSAQLVCYWMLGGVAAWVLFYIFFGFIGMAGY